MPTPAFASAHTASPGRLRAIEPNGHDMALLQRHVAHCGQAHDRWAATRSVAAAVHHFLAPRFATTLTLMLVVIVGVSMAV